MKNIKTERGQSLVELSISLVILLWLLSGAVEFGMAYFQFVQLRDAAQEGALYGAINPIDNAGIRARVRGSSQSPIKLDDLTVVPDSDIIIKLTNPDPDLTKSACEGIGNGIKVEIKYEHKVFMPFISIITGPTIPLAASVTDTILSPTC